MGNIYNRTRKQVSEGASFSISFEKRCLKIDGKYAIKDGQYDGELGCPPVQNIVSEIEKRYEIYQHSVPSQRSESKRRKYFRALPEKDLSDDDMFFGSPREVAQFELEMFILCQIIQGAINWNDFAEGLWFWQSSHYPPLVMLKKWFN